MKDLIIIIENENQKSRLELTTSHEQRIIEEITTYLENGEIFKISSTKETYKSDMNLETIKKFFNIQLNTLIEFYRVRGEFQIKML